MFVNFSLERSIEILERTPGVLDTMLNNVSSSWTSPNEGGDSWSVYDVVGNLIHGEKTDWIPRARIILSESSNKAFESFDRFAQFEASKGKSLDQLLAEFKEARKKNIAELRSWNLQEKDFTKKGIHPAFGDVTLAQLLSTWVVHDLNHIAQISRVMAKQYKTAVGPWVEYLGILNK
jgi:hypothetical protein